MNLQIEYVPIDSIKPYVGNAKLHPQEQIEQIKVSIETLGFDDPIAIWKNGEIIEGHGRYMAAQQLGMKEVPIIRLDDLTDEQRRQYTLIHNKLTMNSGFDMATLALELADLDFDKALFGFIDDIELDDPKETQKKEILYEEMQLKAFEHYDYIVFVFKNQMDWHNAVNRFGLKKVNAGYGQTKKIGLGRVVDGARLLEAIRNPDSNTEQRTEQVDFDSEIAPGLD